MSAVQRGGSGEMPDEQPQAVETTTATTAGTASTETGKDGKPFDAERAQRTIDQLRDEVKAGKSTRTELEAAKARLKELEDRDKTELERATAKAAEHEQKLTETETRLRSMAVRVAVAETAAAAGIAPENVKAAIRLLDISAIEMDDDGEPKNVEAALKQLVKDFPILAAQTTTTTATASKSTPATPKPAGAPNREDRVKQTQHELAASRRYTL